MGMKRRTVTQIAYIVKWFSIGLALGFILYQVL